MYAHTPSHKQKEKSIMIGKECTQETHTRASSNKGISLLDYKNKCKLLY